MRLSRRELLAGAAAVAAMGIPERTEPAPTCQQPQTAGLGRMKAPHAANLPIRDYLVHEARRITDRSLGDLKTPADFKRLMRERRRQFMDMKSPGEDRLDSDEFARQIGAPWVKVIVETRGTGDTSWGEDLNWHLRRATAWTGRTIASMRVWDTLRAIEAARTLPGIDASQISLAARGEMSAVALYAALLDGRVEVLFLDSPPATQNAASQQNGKGPALEMLNCLRYTDLPHIAGLLHPAEIVISGESPSSYDWAADLYTRLGSAGKFRRVKALSEWTTAF